MPLLPSVARVRSSLRSRASRAGAALLAALAMGLVLASVAGAAGPRLGFTFPYGFVDHRPELDGTSRADAVRAVAPAADEIKVALMWFTVQDTCADIKAGRFDWTLPDRDMKVLAEEGVRPVLLLRRPPECASVKRRRGLEPRGEYRAYFAKFARKAVERYGPRGDFLALHPELPARGAATIEVWNEPNLRKKWSAEDPRDYGRFFIGVAKAVRAADNYTRAVKVVTGGLANISSDRYLRRLYGTPKLRRFADAIGLHTYAPSPAAAIRILAGTRELIARNRDDAAIAVTEHAWATCPQPDPAYRRGKCVTAAQQASHLEGYVERLRAKSRLGVSTMLWYTSQDFHEAADVLACPKEPKHFFGLFRKDGTAKPAWATWQGLYGITPASTEPIPPNTVPGVETGC